MTITHSIKVDLPEKSGELLNKLRKKVRNPSLTEKDYQIVKKSIDARDKSRVQHVYSVTVGKPKKPKIKPIPQVNLPKRPVVVGTGPAGLFCALQLAEAGAKPIIIERGKAVEERQVDVDAFRAGGPLDVDSNIQFGEGGAGSFSDGKLTTGIKDPRIKHMLETFVRFGAPDEILISPKPHVGTDKLLPVIAGIRQHILSLGGDYRFSQQFVDFTHVDNQLTGVIIREQSGGTYTLDTDHVVVALGHSARETYEMLHAKQVDMTAKAFAVGLRVEHHQSFINGCQYGGFSPYLPASDYKLAVKSNDERGVYTFCMCPGGVVVPAASEAGGVVVNGMSYHARDEDNANSAILVAVSPEDYGDLGNPLAGIAFQRQLERAAFVAGGSNYHAPVQLVSDFLAGRVTTALQQVTPSYTPGYTFVDFNQVLPDYLAKALCEGLARMDQKIGGFADNGAVLTGIESRSSAPVRFSRDAGFNSSVQGLHPCGEGAGYAGGITSSAVDGMKCAEAILSLYPTVNAQC